MLTPDQIDDFVKLTLSEFKRNKWTDISLEHQEYVSAQIVASKKVVEDGGKDISFRVKTKNTGNARITGLYAQDVAKVEDVTIEGSVGWSKQTTNWSYDVDEPGFQSDRTTIINLLKIREHDALSDMAELMEECMWGAPTSSADKRPMGIPFWLQKDATTTAEGAFNGGNPSGFSGGAAGIDSTLYPRWRNWTFGYSEVTTLDMVRKFKKSLAFTNFMPPVPHPELGFGGSSYAAYSTYRVVEPLERLAESRNDNLGSDVAKYIGAVTIGGVPVKWVPYLENNDTSDPIYGINWKVLRPYVRRGCDMRRSDPLPAPGHTQHTVRTVHIDNFMNWICYNRRACFVGSK